ncbi:hypothetical protein QFC20_006319 [Naganishia adeliensis]|uniref:Uncharacterized protein n=1 Tax=Naganishia adeliensis TaxID=92952 RepID=A0ACC2VDA6_9TREE|nr:hypothetical protein QFC20_006319 [Naganishia adeliensis]
MLAYNAVFLLNLLVGQNGLRSVRAHDGETITSRMEEFVANQQPVSENFAHPMKHSRRWGTTTPKLENELTRDGRVRVRRQASAVFTSTATATSSSASSSPTAGNVDTSVNKAGMGWTSESGTNWDEYLPDSGTTMAKRSRSERLSKRLSGSVIGWTYDWNSQIVPGTPLDRLDFVPMAWGSGSAAGFAADSANFDALGVSHLLSFNEPDQQFDVGGSSLNAQDGAKYHQLIFNSTLAAKYRIGAPAVARGSKWWLEGWIRECAGQCAYDFVPLHFYGTNADDMIAYIKDFITSFGKPVWVTEYACLDFGQNPPYFCTASEEEEFHRKASGYMYNEPLVERYAAFGTLKSWGAAGYPSALMDSDGHITDLGRLYATTT